jgi:ArsR family metal-binding transcriptional regulator
VDIIGVAQDKDHRRILLDFERLNSHTEFCCEAYCYTFAVKIILGQQNLKPTEFFSNIVRGHTVVLKVHY